MIPHQLRTNEARIIAIVLLMFVSVWIIAQVGRIVARPPEPHNGGKVVLHDAQSITVQNARREESVYTITASTEVVRGRDRVSVDAITNGNFVLVEESTEVGQLRVAKRIVILPGSYREGEK